LGPGGTILSMTVVPIIDKKKNDSDFDRNYIMLYLRQVALVVDAKIDK
jgi:hypothetical protein